MPGSSPGRPTSGPHQACGRERPRHQEHTRTGTAPGPANRDTGQGARGGRWGGEGESALWGISVGGEGGWVRAGCCGEVATGWSGWRDGNGDKSAGSSKRSAVAREPERHRIRDGACPSGLFDIDEPLTRSVNCEREGPHISVLQRPVYNNAGLINSLVCCGRRSPVANNRKLEGTGRGITTKVPIDVPWRSAHGKRSYMAGTDSGLTCDWRLCRCGFNG